MKLVTPRGTRDILPQEALERERVVARINEQLTSRGYLPIETPVIELVDMLEVGGRDLARDAFKLFDLDNKLLALRPDMTLPIARLASSRLPIEDEPQRLRYCGPVFREHESLRGQSRQFTQVGIELIGASGPAADAEIAILMVEACRASGLDNVLLSIGSVAILNAVLEDSRMDESWKMAVMEAAHGRNYVELSELTAQQDVPERTAKLLTELITLRGTYDAIKRCRELTAMLTNGMDCAEALDDLTAMLKEIEREGMLGNVEIDFGVMRSFDYYTGIVIEANIDGLGLGLGGGGRYDNVLGAYGSPAPAAGFALGLERLIAASKSEASKVGSDESMPAQEPRPLRIAVPKGSLFADAVDLLTKAGLDTTGLANPGRLLKVSVPGIEYLIVRPTDIPAFVAYGGADCAIAGKDTLVEADLDAAELLDLEFGACRFIVAEPAARSEGDSQDGPRIAPTSGALRVATKYPNITASYFDNLGEQVEIIKLHGNIELAPLINMADCIVDITATGTTLRENNLRVTADVLSSSARFVANPAALRCDERVSAISTKLKCALEARA